MDNTEPDQSLVRPAIVRIPGWAYARVLRKDAESFGAPHPPRALEIQITCGACGENWRANVEGKKPGELRYTNEGWQSRCPKCWRLNVYRIDR